MRDWIMGFMGKYSIGILLTFVLLASVMLYAFPVVSIITGTKGITRDNFFLTRVAIWGVFLLIFLYSLFVEKESFLLKKESPYPIAFYIKTIFYLYLICCIGGAVLNVMIQEKVSDKLLELNFIFKNDYFLIIFTSFTAGTVEEFLMRGYIQPRIERIYNSPLVGILVSAILFGILHSTYGTISQVVIPFFIGVAFAMFYKLYSNIKILIICHFIIDFISLMAMNFIDIKQLSVF
ncbi:type II CAAX endopeptidase family protein [Chryseobacterium sp.]|uniref:CPBP family intramembrane glutamic endopeptidase n=1 Tax=Chryseobacterium sp. TaxID=1871047 RepID=UPI001B1F75BE|nr:type II CAAX endopeptidase family protein [Chryseobacterium sp.]MBO9690795.1 CPBP family intramembrane metalloprotease [Chryseobacterium sp.]